MSQLGLGMTTAPHEPRGRRSRLAPLIAGLAVVVLLAGLVWAGLSFFRGAADYPGPGSGEVVVKVRPGDTATRIGDTLAAAGVVRSAKAFVAAATSDPNSSSIQPGSYKLLKQMKASDALALLLDPSSRMTNQVVIPEGTQARQIVELVAKATGIPAADLTAILKEPTPLGLPDYAKGNPEGFLFPATYELEPGVSAKQALEPMVRRFDQAAATVNLVQRAQAIGRTPYEVLIVASLVQAEGQPADFAKVSRVIYNRLDQGMKLQLDATVNYALGRSTLKLTNQDIGVVSPYNTYKIPGLPPTPINSPGELALRAALTPAAGDWLYYVTVNPTTGETKFTSSYSEFLKFKAQFEANNP
ncbi:MAG TPA: endolytic transglycosylase MltG [Actinomycetes bacterium]